MQISRQSNEIMARAVPMDMDPLAGHWAQKLTPWRDAPIFRPRAWPMGTSARPRPVISSFCSIFIYIYIYIYIYEKNALFLLWEHFFLTCLKTTTTFGEVVDPSVTMSMFVGQNIKMWPVLFSPPGVCTKTCQN